MLAQSITAPVVYKQFADFPGYRIGDDGSVWSCRVGGRVAGVIGTKWKQLRLRPDKDGYLSVLLYRLDGSTKRFRVGALVLGAFVGACPDGMECCHGPDNDRSNNSLENLRWDTHRNNLADKKNHGTEHEGERHYRARLTREIIRSIRCDYANGEMAKTLAERHGIKTGTVYDIVYRRSWKHIPD